MKTEAPEERSEEDIVIISETITKPPPPPAAARRMTGMHPPAIPRAEANLQPASTSSHRCSHASSLQPTPAYWTSFSHLQPTPTSCRSTALHQPASAHCHLSEPLWWGCHTIPLLPSTNTSLDLPLICPKHQQTQISIRHRHLTSIRPRL